jgi:hypothetical protein
LKKIIALTLASLSLTVGLAVAAPAHPGRTTNAPPPVLAARIRNAELSALRRQLAKLHLKRGARPSARELKALGLRPVPKPLAARLNKLAKSTSARVADVGSTYWFRYQYYGHFWADVYYDGPYPTGYGQIYYDVFSNYQIWDYQGTNCINLNVWTEVSNIQEPPDGTWYYNTPDGPDGLGDSAGLPEYGWVPLVRTQGEP